MFFNKKVMILENASITLAHFFIVLEINFKSYMQRIAGYKTSDITIYHSIIISKA